MKRPYLEITFRKGRPLAAYLYLPRPTGARAARSSEARPGVLVDYDATGTPIGVEITDPARFDAHLVNEVLNEVGAPSVDLADLEPLKAA
jgi:uncharacterized protein DUF2283